MNITFMTNRHCFRKQHRERLCNRPSAKNGLNSRLME
jgi:hypothetical protein